MNSISVQHIFLLSGHVPITPSRDVFLLSIRNLTQWPLPPVRPASESTSILNNEQTRDQLNELQKKITPVKDVIISLRPRKKFSLFEKIPDFEFYDNDENATDHGDQSPSTFVESDDNDFQEPLSRRLYNEFDGIGTTRTSSLAMCDDLCLIDRLSVVVHR